MDIGLLHIGESKHPEVSGYEKQQVDIRETTIKYKFKCCPYRVVNVSLKSALLHTQLH